MTQDPNIDTDTQNGRAGPEAAPGREGVAEMPREARIDRSILDAHHRRVMAGKIMRFEYVLWHILCAIVFINDFSHNKYSMSMVELIEYFFVERGLIITVILIIVNLMSILLQTTPAYYFFVAIRKSGKIKLGHVSVNLANASFNNVQPKVSDFSFDEISSISAALEAEQRLPLAIVHFKSALDRSQKTMASAQGRPIALIFIGTIISVIGMVFFVATLPTVESLSFDRLAAEVPRLLMLLFIQVLAGFFLKQYRSATEDFRYYEANLRRREDQFASLLVINSLSQQTGYDKIIEDLLSAKDVMRLQSGETTVTIEVDKLQQNEFADLTEKSFSMIGKIFERNREKKD